MFRTLSEINFSTKDKTCIKTRILNQIKAIQTLNLT